MMSKKEIIISEPLYELFESHKSIKAFIDKDANNKNNTIFIDRLISDHLRVFEVEARCENPEHHKNLRSVMLSFSDTDIANIIALQKLAASASDITESTAKITVGDDGCGDARFYTEDQSPNVMHSATEIHADHVKHFGLVRHTAISVAADAIHIMSLTKNHPSESLKTFTELKNAGFHFTVIPAGAHKMTGENGQRNNGEFTENIESAIRLAMKDKNKQHSIFGIEVEVELTNAQSKSTIETKYVAIEGVDKQSATQDAVSYCEERYTVASMHTAINAMSSRLLLGAEDLADINAALVEDDGNTIKENFMQVTGRKCAYCGDSAWLIEDESYASDLNDMRLSIIKAICSTNHVEQENLIALFNPERYRMSY